MGVTNLVFLCTIFAAAVAVIPPSPAPEDMCADGADFYDLPSDDSSNFPGCSAIADQFASLNNDCSRIVDCEAGDDGCTPMSIGLYLESQYSRCCEGGRTACQQSAGDEGCVIIPAGAVAPVDGTFKMFVPHEGWTVRRGDVAPVVGMYSYCYDMMEDGYPQLRDDQMYAIWINSSNAESTMVVTQTTWLSAGEVCIPMVATHESGKAPIAPANGNFIPGEFITDSAPAGAVAPALGIFCMANEPGLMCEEVDYFRNSEEMFGFQSCLNVAMMFDQSGGDCDAPTCDNQTDPDCEPMSIGDAMKQYHGRCCTNGDMKCGKATNLANVCEAGVEYIDMPKDSSIDFPGCAQMALALNMLDQDCSAQAPCDGDDCGNRTIGDYVSFMGLCCAGGQTACGQAPPLSNICSDEPGVSYIDVPADGYFPGCASLATFFNGRGQDCNTSTPCDDGEDCDDQKPIGAHTYYYARCCTDRKTACGVGPEPSAMCDDPSTYLDLPPAFINGREYPSCEEAGGFFNSNAQNCDAVDECDGGDEGCEASTVGAKLISMSRCCSNMQTACGSPAEMCADNATYFDTQPDSSFPGCSNIASVYHQHDGNCEATVPCRSDDEGCQPRSMGSTITYFGEKCCSEGRTSCGVALKPEGMCKDNKFIDLPPNLTIGFYGCSLIANWILQYGQECSAVTTCSPDDEGCQPQVLGDAIRRHYSQCCENQETACGTGSKPEDICAEGAKYYDLPRNDTDHFPGCADISRHFGNIDQNCDYAEDCEGKPDCNSEPFGLSLRNNYARCCEGGRTACGDAPKPSDLCDAGATYLDLPYNATTGFPGCREFAQYLNRLGDDCKAEVPCPDNDPTCDAPTVGETIISMFSSCCSGGETICQKDTTTAVTSPAFDTTTTPAVDTTPSPDCPQNCGSGGCIGDQCTSCGSQKILITGADADTGAYLGKCYSSVQCKNSKVQNGALAGAQCSCPGKCHECVSTVDATSCKKCGFKRYLNNNECLTECPPGLTHSGVATWGRRCRLPFSCKKLVSSDTTEGTFGCRCAQFDDEGVIKGNSDCQRCTFEAGGFGEKCTKCQNEQFLNLTSLECQATCDPAANLVSYDVKPVGRTCREPFICALKLDEAGVGCRCPKSVGGANCQVCDWRLGGTVCTRCDNRKFLYNGVCGDTCPFGKKDGRAKAGRECIED
eukprot:m.233717 g.233717  ORF g.233717 m.233717 type:complete len:1181 (+) comp33646_c1_seq3:143-3685(+)